jgi:hypothetical protein
VTRFIKKYLPLAFRTLFFAALISVTITSQLAYDRIVNPVVIWITPIQKHIVSPTIVNNFSFGFRAILADFYWISIIQDYAEWDHKDPFYVREYKNLVTLDPQFEYPYIFGILTSASSVHNKHVDDMESVAQVGIDALPYNWEIPFYLGAQLNVEKEYYKALHYLGIAVSRPIVPQIVRGVYDSYEKKKITGDAANRAFVKSIYETTTNQTTKKMIKNSIAINDIVKILNEAIGTYQKRYGYYPATVEDLVAVDLVQITPLLQKEFSITINKDTGAVGVIIR